MAVDGSWNVTISTPMGDRQAKLEVASDGGALSGTWTGPQGAAEISGGTVEGDTMAWQVAMSGPMGQVTLTFEGVVNGDELTGKMQTPRGEGTFTGTRG